MAERLHYSIYRLAWLAACLMPFLLGLGRAAADAGMTILGVYGVVYLAIHRRCTWEGRPDVAAALALGGVVFCVCLTQLPSNPTAHYGLAWIRFILAYVALRCAILPDAKKHALVVRCGLVALALLMVDTYWQYITGVSLSGRPIADMRLSGPLSNYNIGNLLLKLACPVLPAALVLAAHTRNIRLACGALLLSVAVILLIPLTGERSITVLLLVGACAFFAALWWKKPHYWPFIVSGAAMLGAILVLAALTQPVVEARVALLHEQLTNFSQTVYGQLFEGGILLFLQHPLQGVGVGQYLHACTPWLEAGRLTYCDIHAHNFYMQLLSETGIFGGAALVVLAATCVLHWWRMPARSAPDAIAFAGAAAGLTVLLFPVIITQSLFSNWPAALFWFSLALTMSLTDRRKEKL